MIQFKISVIVLLDVSYFLKKNSPGQRSPLARALSHLEGNSLAVVL